MKLSKHIFFLLLSFFVLNAKAQHVTIAPGEWSDGTIWNLGTPPTSSSGSITVNHNVSIPNGYSVTIDETTVNATLSIDVGGQLTLADGTGVDLTMEAGATLVVNGEFIRNNLSTLNQDVASTASFIAGSIYRHRYQTTEGAPPVATWDATSNFYLEGFTNTSTLDLTSSAWNQNFGNFIYNCTGQRSIVNFNGLVTNILGNLSFLSTGNNVTKLTDNEVNVTTTIAGNLTLSGTSRIYFSDNGTGGVLNLFGNYLHNSTSTLGTYLTNTGSFTFNLLGGDFIMTANSGRLYMAGSGGSTGNSTLNIYHNFTLNSGVVTEAGTGTANGNIRFVGNGSFTFVNSGSIQNRINWYIAPTVTLNLATYPIASGSGSSLTVDGSTLICGSLEPTGAIRTVTNLGNIRTPNALRNYVSGTTIIYRSSSPQFMGDGQPSVAGVTTVIDNAQGVTMYQGATATITINGTLQLESGMLFIGARTLSLTGAITYNAGTFGGNASSVLNIGGTTGGNIGTLTFDPSNNILGTLTVNRTGASASVGVNATLTIASQLNLTNGDLNNTSGLAVGNGCIVTRYPTAQLLLNRFSVSDGDLYDLTYRTASTSGTSVTYSTGLELPAVADDDALNDLTISTGQVADVVEISQDFTVNGDVSLNRGSLSALTFTIIIKGTSWADNSGNFTPGSGTVRFSGVTTIGGTSTPQLGNIELTDGNTLIVGKNFNLSGDVNFESGSIFIPSIYTITLNGAALQTLSPNGAEFFNITVAKSGGNVQLTSVMGLLSILRFNTPTSNCDFQSNGFLTLISTNDAAGDATSPNQGQIYRLASGNTVSGDVIVQRYMSGEGRIYRYLSSPLSDATVASWKDDFPITGTFADPSSGQTVCGLTLKPSTPSLYYYDETVAGNVNIGYVAYPSADLASNNPLIVGRGYAAFVRECTNPTVIDVTGTINQGTVNFGITYTITDDASADGYNLLGNPYPCTIDWDNGFTKIKISNIISTKDNGTGVMLYWDGTTGDIPNGEIAVGQAFWVRATGINPILRASENSKVLTPDQSAEFFRKAPPTDFMTISLTDGKIKDKAYLKVRSVSKNTFDDWDAPKLNNDFFDLYTTSEDQVALAINSLNHIDCSSSFVLGIKDMEKKTYTISMDDAVGVFGQYSLTLTDQYTGQRFPFNGPYQFTVDANPLSSSTDRFLLQLGPKVLAAPVNLDYPPTLCVAENAAIKLTSSIASVHYKLFDANQRLITEQAGTGNNITLPVTSQDLNTGINKFTVMSVSACGISYDSKEVQIVIEQSPDLSVEEGSSCGEGTVSLTAIGVPEGYQVNWFGSSESAEVIGTGLMFETPLLSKTSTYYVSAISPNGCVSIRMPAVATVVNLKTPVITQPAHNLLQVDVSRGIQWYFNGNLLEGAVNQTIDANETGTYSVTVYNSGCTASGSYEYLVTGIENNESYLSIYPNPVERYLYIKDDKISTDNVFFFDNLGRSNLANAVRENGMIRVDMENLASGIYVIQFEKEGKIIRSKINKK